MGRVYDALGQKQKALDFYNQALPLFRAVGDRSGEATTLNNIGAVQGSNEQ
ncbi:MAG: tetratricopeptide repeat protein [Nostoc sp.]